MERKKYYKEEFFLKKKINEAIKICENALKTGNFTKINKNKATNQLTANYKKWTVWGEITISFLPNKGGTKVTLDAWAYVDNMYALKESPGQKIFKKFKEGLINGQETYTAADKDKTVADGDKYVGKIDNDKRHGQGIFKEVLISFISLPALFIGAIFKLFGRSFKIAFGMISFLFAAGLTYFIFCLILFAIGLGFLLIFGILE